MIRQDIKELAQAMELRAQVDRELKALTRDLALKHGIKKSYKKPDAEWNVESVPSALLKKLMSRLVNEEITDCLLQK